MRTGKWMKIITMLLIVALTMTSMPTMSVLAYEGTEAEENANDETEMAVEDCADVVEIIGDNVETELEFDKSEDSIEIIEEMQGNEFADDIETVFSDEEEIQRDPLEGVVLNERGNIADGISNNVNWMIDAEGMLTIS